MKHPQYWADKATQHEARVRKHDRDALWTLSPLEAMKSRKLAAKNRALAEEAHRRAEAAKQ